MNTCRYVPGYGHYLRAHAMNCKDPSCEGCQPCTHDNGTPVRHCTARPSCCSHLDPTTPATCPKCVGRTRTDITKILQAVELLPEEALIDGVDSEAANLYGPAADPVAWTRRRITQLRAGRLLDPEDPHHPKAVLGRWEHMTRERLLQPATQPISMHTAASYLDTHLDRLAQDPDEDWPLLVREIRACRSHLEDTVNTARRPERGAPCPSCSQAPALVKRYDAHDVTGASDTWRCPSCRTSWTEGEYRKWVADDYLQNAESLSAVDMRTVYGISPVTLRKWAERGLVAKRSRDNQGRQTYDVADTRKRLEEAEIKPAAFRRQIVPT